MFLIHSKHFFPVSGSQQSIPSTSVVHQQHRKFFDKVIKTDGKLINDQKTSKQFINAMIEHDQPLDVLSKVLVGNGAIALSQALTLNFSFDFIKDSFIPLLEWLGRDYFLMGDRRGIMNRLLIYIWKESSVLFSSVDQEFNRLATSDKDLDALGWFILELVSSGNDSAKIAREDTTIKSIAEKLLNAPSLPIVAKKIQIVLDGGKLGVDDHSLGTLKEERPGGRHNNDHADYRSIAIIPTKAEITSLDPPYLPKPVPLKGLIAGEAEAAYLDRQFRLLREDIVGPLREELALLNGAHTAGNATQKRRLAYKTFNNLKIVSVSPIRFRFCVVKVEFDQPIKLQHQQPQSTDQQSKKYNEYWSNHERLLKKDSVVCIVRNKQPLRFGTIQYRELQDLSVVNPSIGLVFYLDADLEATLQELNCTPSNTSMIQISAPVFAYEPILRGLQRTSSIPFSKELLSEPQPSVDPPEYLSRIEPVLPAISIGSFCGKTLDPSQIRAVLKALTNRIGLIQGPPGTGKSFCGALVGKVILDQTSETILCVCYTNHALDQFLEDLISNGVTDSDIIRIGGSGKVSDRIKPLTLQEQSKNNPGKRVIPFRLQKMLNEEADELQIEIEKEQNDLQALASPLWSTIKDYLENHFDYRHYLAAFELPPAPKGFHVVGKKNKLMSPELLWKRWIQGKNRPPTVSLANTKAWELKKDDRVQLLQTWLSDIKEPTIDKLVENIKKYNETRLLLRDIQFKNDFELLKGKRVIGCTTTGAAIYHKQLAEVNAGVLLVEEAGEILESHIVTSLREGCKHLIMIGDHRQLRPKVNQYQLTVESGRGFDLNRSLFERLILEEFPFETLELQHRMRPEISEIVKTLTYPNLRDDPVVSSYPALRGIQKNIVFIDHNQPEGDDEKIKAKSDRNSGGDEMTLSKTNQFVYTKNSFSST